MTANLQYTGIVFSTIWGMLIWSDTLSWPAWTGILVVLGSGMATTFYNTRATAAPVNTPLDADPIATEV